MMGMVATRRTGGKEELGCQETKQLERTGLAGDWHTGELGELGFQGALGTKTLG